MSEPEGLRVEIIAEDALEVAAPDPATAQAMAAALRGLAVFAAVVPAPASVAVLFDPRLLDAAAARAHLVAMGAMPARPAAAGPPLRLPVRYGGEHGPDLGRLAEAADLSAADFAARHAAAEYTVACLGFTPGFAYLDGLPASLSAQRLSVPRLRVPAGSVGISPGRTGVYALDGPGGWPIIGRCMVRLFDQGAARPFRLSPSARVRFEAV